MQGGIFFPGLQDRQDWAHSEKVLLSFRDFLMNKQKYLLCFPNISLIRNPPLIKKTFENQSGTLVALQNIYYKK